MRRLLKTALPLLLIALLCGCKSSSENSMYDLTNDFQDTFETTAVPESVIDAMSDLIQNYTGGVKTPSNSITNLNNLPNQPTGGSASSSGSGGSVSPTSPSGGSSSSGSPSGATIPPGTSAAGDTVPHDVCNTVDEAKEDILYYMTNIIPDFTIEIASSVDYSSELMDYVNPYFAETYVIESMYMESCSLSYSIGTNNTVYSFSISHEKPVGEVVDDIDESRQELDSINSKLKLDSLSDYEVIDTINTYLCDNVVYPDQPYSDESFTIYGAVIEGSAVCEGYAKTVKALLDMNDIECYYVTGNTTGGAHGWNLVKLDGQWYHLDVTWNDTGNDRMAYFLVTDDYMSYSRTWDTSNYPASAKSNYQ